LCEGRGDAAEQAVRQLKAGETIISVGRRYQQNLDPLNPPEDDPKIARIVQDDQNLEGKLKTNWFATIPHHWDWARDYAKEMSWSGAR